MFSRIVVPLDGLPLAEQTIPHVVTIAGCFRATVALVRVIDTSRLDPFGDGRRQLTAEHLQQAIARERRAALDYLEKISSRLNGHGVKTSSTIVQGFVKQAILGQLEQDDMLVLASRAGARADSIDETGIVASLIRQARVPVLVIPPQATGSQLISILRNDTAQLP